MRILFIGGTGVISSACSDLVLARGHSLTLLNRGRSIRPAPAGAELIHADIRDGAAARAALSGRRWDAAVDFISFTPEHVGNALAALEGKVDQYAFISSASAYRKPPVALPVVESNFLDNPFWEYSRNKIACEQLLMERFRAGWPVTIVRPSHTYDKTLLPMDGGWYVVDRMLKGLEVVVHGDGTSLWTLTHHRDFAVGLVGLLGQPYALGEAFHITSDEWLSWNEIFRIVGKAAGAEPRIVHVPSEAIARLNPDWGAGLLGDKAHSMIFDNSKIRRIVPDFRPSIPFSLGAREIVDWYMADPARRTWNPAFAEKYERVLDWAARGDASRGGAARPGA
jgi:nucleoside-diphosphate-sugar epimerase